MSNKEAVRTDGPVLFLTAPLRPQPDSPITLNVNLIGIATLLDPGPELQALSALAPSLSVPAVILSEAQC